MNEPADGMCHTHALTPVSNSSRRRCLPQIFEVILCCLNRRRRIPFPSSYSKTPGNHYPRGRRLAAAHGAVFALLSAPRASTVDVLKIF